MFGYIYWKSWMCLLYVFTFLCAVIVADIFMLNLFLVAEIFNNTIKKNFIESSPKFKCAERWHVGSKNFAPGKFCIS